MIILLYYFESGYNHKLNILLAKVIRAINELHEKLDENLFERIKDKVSAKLIFAVIFSILESASIIHLDTSRFFTDAQCHPNLDKTRLGTGVEKVPKLLTWFPTLSARYLWHGSLHGCEEI